MEPYNSQNLCCALSVMHPYNFFFFFLGGGGDLQWCYWVRLLGLVYVVVKEIVDYIPNS